MKKANVLWVSLMLLLLLSCGGKQEKVKDVEERIYQMEMDKHTGVQRMQPSVSQGNVVIAGAEYHYEVHRNSCDSLKMVSDEQGTQFVDNVIELKILRNGNQKVFYKRFTKHYFAGQVGADFMKNGILEGLVFDKVQDGRLFFAASVCYPQTDLFIPLSVQISPKGAIAVERIYMMDEHQEQQDTSIVM